MKTPLELVQALLSNPTNIDHVRGLTTSDVIYVSLNFDNPELHKVLPWTGTNRGPQRIVDVFNGIGRVWETKAFEIRDVVANEHSVAMFGSFTYKTRMLGKEITSPFALLARVTGEKISYLQFLEDTFGTASTFRASGTWHFRGVATGDDVSVGTATRWSPADMAVAPLGRSQLAIDRTMQARVVVVRRRPISFKPFASGSTALSA